MGDGGVAHVANPRFDRFFAEHEAHLRLVATRLCGNGADAADLVQDAFERALRNYDKLAPGTNPRAWVVTILHNLFIDRCRKHQRQGPTVQVDDMPLAAASDVPEPEPLWARLGPDDLERALAQLDPDFRAIYRMHALENRSYKEISATLGIPTATVGTRLLRARDKLKKLLAAANSPTPPEEGSR
jgi:RNA polymerase sigma-70 factor (ECF subfamily)